MTWPTYTRERNKKEIVWPSLVLIYLWFTVPGVALFKRHALRAQAQCDRLTPKIITDGLFISLIFFSYKTQAISKDFVGVMPVPAFSDTNINDGPTVIKEIRDKEYWGHHMFVQENAGFPSFTLLTIPAILSSLYIHCGGKG